MKTISIFKKISLLYVFIVFVSCSSSMVLKYNTIPAGGVAYKQLDVFGGYIWHRDKKGKININKKNLQNIYIITKNGNEDYFEFLESYSFFLCSHSDKRRIAKSLNFSERTLVAAYCVEYLYKCQKEISESNMYKNYRLVRLFLRTDNGDSNKYNREFKKHDYYGLKLLKKHHLKHYKYFPDLDTIRYKKSISD